MKEFIVILACLLLPFQSFTQERDFLPFYTPPSPNAYELGKYGQIPVGMFTGAPDFTLPLCEFKTKNMTVPVSVSYCSNGIKVDQVESKVGLGWNLNAGGVIARIVRDLPDEEQGTFFPEEDIEENGINGPLSADFFYQAGQDQIDTETDLFLYNFAGKSGKFVFDNNKTIIQLPHTNLKIEMFPIDEEKNGYIITDANGIRYIFSHTEISRSHTNPAGSHPDPSFVITSWYLTKMIHPDGDIVVFKYESEFYEYTSSISQTLEVLYPKIQVDGCGDLIFMPPLDKRYENHSVINGWRLTEISGSNTEYGKVKFSYSPSYNQIGIPGNRLINTINVIDKDSNEMENFTFCYDFYSNSNRIFLDSIHFKDPEKFYKFDYIDPSSMAPRLSFMQDHWGYYNGANQNTCLVPKITNDNAFIGQTMGADREPNPNFSQKGLLSKITYPTKGSTELTYEPNTYYGEEVIYPPLKESYLVTSTDDEGMGNNPVVDTIFSAINQPVDVTVYVDYNAPPCDPENNIGRSRATLEIINMTTNQHVAFYTISITGLPVPRSNVFTDNPPVTHCLADLNANTLYKVILTPQWECVRTSSTIHYYDEAPDTIIQNITTGGSRIKRMVSFDPVRNLSNITRYYYGSIDSLNISSGDPGLKAYYITRQNRREECNQPVLIPYLKTVKILSSSSLTPLFNTGNNNIYYRTVTVSHGGDDFENGGEEFNYIIHRDIVGNCLAGEEIKSAPWTNTGWDNGLLRRSSVFKKDDSGGKTILKETLNHYTTDSRIDHKTLGYSVRKEYEVLFPQPAWYTCTAEDVTRLEYSYNCQASHRHCYFLLAGQSYCIAFGANNVATPVNNPCYGLTPNTSIFLADISNLDIMEYKNLTYWHYLDSTMTIQYDQSGSNPIRHTIHYKYDNPSHLQVTRTQSVSSDGDSIRQVIFYPQDLTQSSILDSLINKHRISERIKEEKHFKADNQAWKKITTRFNNFHNWGNGIIQPATIEESIYSDAPEPRIRIYQVDNTNGNTLEFSKEDDMHTSLVWGYQKTKPVVEGKNISYTDLYNAVTTVNSNLEQLLSPSGIGDLTTQSQRNAWKEFNESLRGQSLLSNSIVTTYTYKPLVGLTSVTDPAGYTTYYEYDNYGRLIFVRDNEYNTLKSYLYHYADDQASK
jgi:YD repeat-containing protein